MAVIVGDVVFEKIVSTPLPGTLKQRAVGLAC